MIIVEDYSMIFKLHGKKEVQCQENDWRRRVAIVIIQKYIHKWLVRCAYLNFLSVTTSIQCCWRKVLAIREFRKLKQEANEVVTNPIQASRGECSWRGREWYGSALWYDLSKVKFGFWRKRFYRPVLRYWA
jgi:hypothetical protein